MRFFFEKTLFFPRRAIVPHNIGIQNLLASRAIWLFLAASDFSGPPWGCKAILPLFFQCQMRYSQPIPHNEYRRFFVLGVSRGFSFVGEDEIEPPNPLDNQKRQIKMGLKRGSLPRVRTLVFWHMFCPGTAPPVQRPFLRATQSQRVPAPALERRLRVPKPKLTPKASSPHNLPLVR